MPRSRGAGPDAASPTLYGMPGNPRRQRARPPTPVILLAMLAALATVVASTSFLMRPAVTPQGFALARDVPTLSAGDPAVEPRGLHLLLVPHPDDELSAWTSLLEADDLMPVMVLLTQGEATQRCSAEVMDRHLQAGLGEVAPDPDPTTEGGGSPACREARLGSFRRAMTQAATHTPAVQLDWSTSRPVDFSGLEGHVVTGPSALLIALDLGDDTLTADAVAAAARELLRSPDTGLPDLPLVRITSSAYYATDEDTTPCDSLAVCPPGEAAYVYDRPDHLAVRDAARALAPLAQDGSWLVTHSYDPRAGRHLALPQDLYDDFMGLGPGELRTAQRLGTYQQIYGWLAFPDVWRPGDLPLQDGQVMFPRVQSYEVVAP